MTVYWVLLAWPVFWALRRKGEVRGSGSLDSAVSLNGLWWFTYILLTLIVGFRYEVGGDWSTYLWYLEYTSLSSFFDILTFADPGYHLLNWASNRLGSGIWGVNLVSAGLFSYGLVVFCRSLPRPWLALAVAVPYLVLVVSMGYTRQGIAIGLTMLALTALGKQQLKRFAFWVLLAATFHMSAVLLLPVAALASTRNRYWTFFWISLISVLAYFTLLDQSVELLFHSYVTRQYQSEGAFVRLAMNALPAAVLILSIRRFRIPPNQVMLWIWFSIFSIVLFAALPFTAATTALDRLALYLLPLQMLVFSYLPDVFGRTRQEATVLIMGIVAYYAAVMFVWLNFAAHSQYWIPYRFFPLEALQG